MNPTVEAVVTAMKAPARSLADQYATTIDAHLATLPDDNARRRVLADQLETWNERYSTWQRGVDSGRVKIGHGEPTAFDFIETIAVIGNRIGKYRAPAPEPSKEFWEGRQ